MAETVAVIGAGFIGRAWAIVFARGGRDVRLHDADRQVLGRAEELIDASLADLTQAGLVADRAAVRARIAVRADLDEALSAVDYVQECGPETLETKRDIFADLEARAPGAAILASSSSGIGASQFSDKLSRPDRVLVAHPVNPPHLIPLVEICPGPHTADWAVRRTRDMMDSVGQTPVTVRKEVKGFVLNRLQAAVLNEALRLYEDDVISAEDLDRTVRDGLGLRWSFMGPFETIDLNAPGGIADYAQRYGPLFEALAQEQADPRTWSSGTVVRIEDERRNLLSANGLEQRQTWRDRRLMALIAHKRQADHDIGD